MTTVCQIIALISTLSLGSVLIVSLATGLIQMDGVSSITAALLMVLFVLSAAQVTIMFKESADPDAFKTTLKVSASHVGLDTNLMLIINVLRKSPDALHTSPINVPNVKSG
jgi:hypothetical protein